MNEIDDIRAHLATISPGPWHWSGYVHSRSGMGPYIATWLPGMGRTTVMDCTRFGMQGAQPRFHSDPGDMGMMVKSVDLAIKEVPYRGDIVDINHPDARFMVNAPKYVRALLKEIDALPPSVGPGCRRCSRES